MSILMGMILCYGSIINIQMVVSVVSSAIFRVVAEISCRIPGYDVRLLDHIPEIPGFSIIALPSFNVQQSKIAN